MKYFKGTYDHCTFGWNMLEICGNIILEIKDLEDLTPVKLANHKNPVKDTCGSKDACKDTKCSDKKESVFGQTFSKYQKSTTFHLIGTRNVFIFSMGARWYNWKTPQDRTISTTVGDIQCFFGFHGPPTPAGQRPCGFDK